VDKVLRLPAALVAAVAIAPQIAGNVRVYIDLPFEAPEELS
jgi:hypothetical protein